jgi:hypothetical protein
MSKGFWADLKSLGNILACFIGVVMWIIAMWQKDYAKAAMWMAFAVYWRVVEVSDDAKKRAGL